MPATLQFFDESVQIQPPQGHGELLPITLGPAWQPNDLRLMFITASAMAGGSILEIPMNPNPPTGFSTAYSLNPSYETHGVYYRFLQSGDSDYDGVSWAKQSNMLHFMFSLLTIRGVDPTSTPTGGWLKASQTAGDTTLVASSVAVPGPGTMIFMLGTVSNPYIAAGSLSWPVSLGVPTGWTNIAATDKSGATFYQYGLDPSLIVVAKKYTTAGSTGSVAFPCAQGGPAMIGLYAFVTAAPDKTVTITAA